MKTAIAMLVACFAVAWAGPASAAPKTTLLPGGKTIGGPVDSKIAAGEAITLALPPGTNVCVTLANTGNSAVGITFNGGGSPAVHVPPRETSVACGNQPAEVLIVCGATGNGSCSATWRLDLAE